MSIKWNKVTWYSKIVAVIVFVATFCVGFCLGYIWGRNSTLVNYVNENSKIPNETQKKSAVETTAINIGSQSIKEDNFSGSMPTFSGTSAVVAKAQEYIKRRISEFRTQANTDVPPAREKFGADSPPASYTIDIAAKEVQGEKTESIVLSVDTFTGGANDNTAYKVITASRSDGKILSLSDEIISDKQSDFTQFVKKELNDWKPGTDAPVVFPDEVKALKFDSFSNWSLDDKNLIIYFDKYQIGPGYLGAVAFPIQLSNIKDFLKQG
jgi:hypothetical protein